MGAIEEYTALVDAVESQRDRLQGPLLPDYWGGETAKRFRADPKRRMDDNYEILAAFVRPEDVFVDAGGGAGRFSLPMSLRCRQVINVDPSPGMCQEFEESAADAGIDNVNFVLSDWLDVDGVEGDVVHAAHVTYFVRDITRFVANLESAARRRVMIMLASVAWPMLNAKLFKLVYGEEQALVPSYAYLLPALWEMGVLPDVRFLPQGTTYDGVPEHPTFPQNEEEAVEIALAGIWLAPQHRNRADKVVRDNFDELFHQEPEGFVPRWMPDVRQVLITWEPGKPG